MRAERSNLSLLGNILASGIEARSDQCLAFMFAFRREKYVFNPWLPNRLATFNPLKNQFFHLIVCQREWAKLATLPPRESH